ncbi:penicillin-binding protein 1C [Candidatus Proelusimicrobium excrementi]|uniref:penicillin-binding protein 1C n=1 Tax=Candidatus Proelusimicrobium excrementi TaxID=3416222 RepID=UPI003C9617C8|nr:penicillin-binding protein 1C [Elusimicrobiaceae bacterium]
MAFSRFAPFKRTAVFLAVCLLVLAGLRFYPRPKLLADYSFSKSFFSQDGQLLRMTISYDDKYRVFIPLSDVPAEFREAVLFYEDRHFYIHAGFNPVSLFNAFWTTFVQKSRRRGGSTITMQTARLLYHLDTKTLEGKLKQIILAVWLELRYSKNDILEAYINLAPYGYNIEGAQAASITYFKRRLEDINLVQAFTLAVIPQNPNERHPDTTSGYQHMQKVRGELFEQWVKKHPQDAVQRDFFNLPLTVFGPKDRPFLAPHLVTYLDRRMNRSEVFFSLDLSLQTQYEQTLRTYINRKSSLGINNATAVLLDAQSMQVRALIGSADFYDESISGQVNGTTAKRMAGSVLKSFLFGMALDRGLIHPMSLLRDTPQYFGIYAPENSDRHFVGPVFARDALVRSRNIPAMALIRSVGVDDFIDFLARGGVSKLRKPQHYGLSAAIGSIDISPLECARLYAMVANYGKLRPVSFTRESAINDGEQLLSPEAAFILFDMLTHNPPLTEFSHLADANGEPVKVAWKTGTSYSFKDAWAAGIFGRYVLVVWVGNFSGEGNPHFWGRTAAGELFFELIGVTLRNRPAAHFAPMKPDGLNVKQVQVCAPTGDLPGKSCPQTIASWFIPGVSTLKISSVHREILLDKKTGLRACRYKENETEKRVFEFWPKDILSLFEQAGIHKKPIPRYLPDCDIEEWHQGQAPEIILPVSGISYYIVPTKNKAEVPLKASTDADAQQVFWFVDDIFVGSSASQESLIAPMEQGKHRVTAVDDLDRSSSLEVQVVLGN